MSDYDVQIIGAGVVGAGEFRKVSINGTGSIAGRVTADTVTINGAAKANDLIQARKIEVNGTLSGKELKGEKVVIRGMSDLDGGISCENFELNGSIKCQSINAEQMDIKLKGFGDVRELTGSRISIKGFIPSIVILNIEIKPSIFKVGLVEADDIVLENTEADVVCGNVVQIGRGCKIGRVEYRESLKVADGSSVGQIVKD